MEFMTSASKRSSRKSYKRKTSFSIMRNNLPTKRKNSRNLSYDNEAFDEERSYPQTWKGRPIIPNDRDSVMNGRNVRGDLLPTISSKVQDKTRDPNFAWID
jgi:hypothetical protein